MTAGLWFLAGFFTFPVFVGVGLFLLSRPRRLGSHSAQVEVALFPPSNVTVITDEAWWSPTNEDPVLCRHMHAGLYDCDNQAVRGKRYCPAHL